MSIDTSLIEPMALFSDFPAEHLTLIGERAKHRVYKGSETIVHQFDPGENFFVIVAGTVKISSTLPDGSEVFLALLAAGDTFGEMSLIDSGYRSADVVTQEPTTLVAFDRAMFNQMLDTMPTFSRNLLKLLARRLRLANVRIQALATFDVYGRVARQLLEFGELYGRPQPNGDTIIPIRLTQSDIAQLVGASRERVNQVMVAYRQRGLITIAPNYHVTIHKHKELEKRIQ